MFTIFMAIGLIAGADEVKVKVPAEASVVPGKMLAIVAETNGTRVRWVKPTSPCEFLELSDGKQVVFLSQVPGTYKLYAFAEFGDAFSPLVVCKVTVGNVPSPPSPTPPTPPTPVPPTPTPVPVPPTPVPVPPTPVPPTDPLTDKFRVLLKTEAGTDAEKAKWVASYAAFFDAMKSYVDDKAIVTVGDLMSDYRKALAPSGVPDDKIKLIKTAAVQEFLPLVDDADKILDDDTRKKLKAIFEKLATSLKAV